MKVLILSDTHGLKTELETLFEKHRDETDLFIHCGDSELSADDPVMKKFITVRGNCDHEDRFPLEQVKTIGKRNIFITHGHKYSVKSSLMALTYRAMEASADIVCFGHSHLLGAEMVNNVLFINPGSIRFPRGRRERTYVTIDILKDSYRLKVFDYDKGEIANLEQFFSLSDHDE